MNNDLYSDYVRREPHPRAAVFIQRWHGKLLEHALKEANVQPSTVLEIGPGHGYFAQQCSDRGLVYEFCDTSPAVMDKMSELGFNGHLGLLHENSDKMSQYDLIWMSHVLEHSPTWLDARLLVSTARDLLTSNGILVVVSPDILSWRREFFNVDWSHGYPTAIRNVAQLFSDVGLKNIRGLHHRNASTSMFQRTIFTLLAFLPHTLFDRLLTPQRGKIGDGFLYSWKAVFGWRQIMVIGHSEEK